MVLRAVEPSNALIEAWFTTSKLQTHLTQMGQNEGVGVFEKSTDLKSAVIFYYHCEHFCK